MICLMSFYNISWDLQTKFPFYFRSQNNHFSFIHYSVGSKLFIFSKIIKCVIFWIRLLRMWNAMLIFCWFFIISISSYWFTSHTKTFWRSERAIFPFPFSFCILFIFSFSPPVSFPPENRTNFSLCIQAKILQVQDGSDFESVDEIIQSDHSNESHWTILLSCGAAQGCSESFFQCHHSDKRYWSVFACGTVYNDLRSDDGYSNESIKKH